MTSSWRNRLVARNGGAAPSPDTLIAGYFREAGFTDSEARRGAKLLESGRYFGFADVATSLRPSGVPGAKAMDPAMEAAVQRIAGRVDPILEKTPWGRMVPKIAEASPPASTVADGPDVVYFCDGQRITVAEARALGYGTVAGPRRPITTYRKELQ